MNNGNRIIILKGDIRTSDVKECRYDALVHKWAVTFYNGKTYPYLESNVECLEEYTELQPAMYHISINGKEISHVSAINVFQGKNAAYWQICFDDGRKESYSEKDLKIRKSCLETKQAHDVLEYLHQIAGLNNLRNEETGEKILYKRFSQLFFVGEDVALAKYLTASNSAPSAHENYIPIFPFGCNNSQYHAVKRAMENQISVIQGPPGTGKTQTILNIIANILFLGKTVQVVSNNNAATENVNEKLSLPENGLSFLVAALGNADNKREFIEKQTGKYPDFTAWSLEENTAVCLERVQQKSMKLKDFFVKQERLAVLRQQLAHLKTEKEYFKQYIEELAVNPQTLKSRKTLSSQKWLSLWQECQRFSEKEPKFKLFFKLKTFLKYGIWGLGFYKQDLGQLIAVSQAKYYDSMQRELEQEIRMLEEQLENRDKDLLKKLCGQSMMLLKDKLAQKYKGERPVFTEDDLWRNSERVLHEYPVILSTTFSSRSSLNSGVVYDYLIMDEASQVDVATGALALSCARNVVIVGDTKQLPNVVTEGDKAAAKAVYESFHVSEGYKYTKSFLQSILEIIPDVSQTLLKEHYRCHPKIIDFCNQKFYRGELIIMTQDNGENDVLSAIKTVPGNHAHNHYSQRQIDVIKNEILPQYIVHTGKTGIIAPYKNQVSHLRQAIDDIEVATVHKFQGKEKDTIVISTVDDEISDFADDPYLINVAVSRAKRRLILVVTGNEQNIERNITDLISYIEYNNFAVTDSNIYSIFDYLYKQYTEQRIAYLKQHKKMSEFDSENLMYALIEEILAMDDYASLDVVCHIPLKMLIKNLTLLNLQERKYAKNPSTHVDFLIYNRIGNKPVLALEVDGYEYHKAETVQGSRDVMKNHILELYNIPLLRFPTNGSAEKEKITAKLSEILR